MSWFVVGGIAIGATAGAIVGSKKGGDDVWKDALIGGAIGGTAGYGAGALGAAEAAAPAAVAGEGGAGILGAEAVAGGSGLALGGAGLETGGAMAGGASGAGIMGAEGAATGAAGSSGMGLGQAGGFGSGATFGGSGTSFGTYGGATVPEGGGLLNAGFAPGAQAPIQMIETPAASSELAQVTASPQGDIVNGAQTGANKTGYSLANQSPLEKGFGSAMSWLSEPKNAMLTGVLGLGALSMFNQNNEDNFDQQTVTQSGYPLSPDFKPTRTDPRQFRYKSSYADGGITSVAGQQNTMYPQSQIPDRTQFAVPSQMPTSMEVVGADYDTLTNPYTGDIPRFASGKSVDSSKYMAMIDPKMKAPETHTPDYVGKGGIYYDDDPDTKYQDALTAAQTRMGKAASRANVQLGAMQKPTPMGKLNLGPVVKEKQQAAADDDGLAGGGITSLGGYAHGGNARLLRGPGDGMSDDIPASIGGKQPARLADGEFVVPADVVSGLGNGSTEAGAKKLHQMMDKVRVDRTGTKKQGKQIKADKYIPGMKEGGIASYAAGNLVVNPETNEVGYWSGMDGWGMGGNWNPITQEQYLAAQTPPAPTQPIAPTVNPSQYAMGGSQTPDYRMPGSALGSGLGRWNNLANTAAMEARQPSFNQQVTQSYLQNLGRAPDQSGFNSYMQSGLRGDQIKNIMSVGDEAIQLNPANLSNRNTYVQDLYKQYLGRAPEQAGLTYWNQKMSASPNGAVDVTRGISESPEAQVYADFQKYLGRAPAQAGRDYWTQQFASGKTAAEIATAIQNSEEGKAYAAKQAAAQTEAAKPAEKKRKGGILAAKK